MFPACPRGRGGLRGVWAGLFVKHSRPSSQVTQPVLRTVHSGFTAVPCPCPDRHCQCQRVPEGSRVCEDSYPPDGAVPRDPLRQLRSLGVGTRPVVRASPQRSGLWRVRCRRRGALVLRRVTEGRSAPSQTDSVLLHKPSRGVGGSALVLCAGPRPSDLAEAGILMNGQGSSGRPPPPALGREPLGAS